MTFQEFVIDNLLWVITAVFGFGGFYYLVRNLLKRFDKHEERIEIKFNEFDQRSLDHSREISDLKVQLAALRMVSEHLQRMEARIDDVWKHIMRNGDGSH